MRKSVILLLSLLLAVFVLSGCNNLQEPTKPEDNLLIGRVTLQAENIKDINKILNDFSINKNIQIVLVNTETGEEFTNTTGDQGIFFKRNLYPGQYQMGKIHYQIVLTDSKFSYRWNVDYNFKLQKDITIEPGKVVNLGSMVWYYDGASNKSWFMTERSPEALKDMFSQEFPESLWLEREWLAVQMTGE